MAKQILPALHVVPQHGSSASPHATHVPATHQSPVASHWLPEQQASPVVPQAFDPASESGSPESSADVPASGVKPAS